MKIQSLIENTIQPSVLPSNETWYHCGPAFEQFSTAFLGGGENNHILGHGVYFINNPQIAKGYAKYVKNGEPVLYEVKLNAPSDVFYCSRNKPPEAQASALDEIAVVLGYQNRRSVPYNHSAMKYGRGLPGAVFEKLGAQKGAQLLTQHGIKGQFEDIGDGIFEIAVWDVSVIQIVNKTEMPSIPKPPRDPELDAWFDDFFKENPA